ncbi:MAG: 5-formyltetrahydrofolate cyclo-ligase [Flammeovirgaceae bacterium]|jgi:5-formyltetrahydrofolate cyclo-ligase|nr:5-formyltetrahydrofolate cyclo-ligase [Flammeovirgaceae bacterium]
MTKVEARKAFLQKRLALSEGAYQQLNFQLYNQFFAQIDLSFIKCIHIFLPIENKKEPDTWPIIDRIRREFPHVRISIPKVVGDQLENIYFEGLHQLKKNKWGILEPEQGVPTPTEKIEMVLVPLLAFDKSGNRVGYGKGFYDQFLAECRIRCQRVGISFFPPIDVIEDVDENDIVLSQCITPRQFFAFGNML